MTAAPLRLISSMATREVLAELVDAFTAREGHAVALESAGGVDVARRVRDGEAVDLVVLAAKAIDELIAAGRLLPDSRVDILRSGIAIAVPAGAPLPDIRTEAALKQAVLAAPTLSYSTGPSGVYLMGLFDRWGILEDIRPRIVQAPPGVPVGSLVARGEVALGFQQLSELLHVPGIALVGPMPPEVQSITTFSGAVSCEAVHPEQARALLAWMTHADAAPAIRRQGMEPA
ncbi:MAG: substrate-binding domain-containing protein [Rhodoferax sp.]|nr:substrate-binding domain-containing protein [Rhodoferax sp.]